jgi:hypothetical protein
MQISTSLQNTYTTTQTAELSKTASTAPTVPTDTSALETDTINKSAYNYFDLSEDISPYTQTDPVQEKTNQELVTYLSGIMNNTTAEGKKNSEAFFDTTWYAADLTMQKKLASLPPPKPLPDMAQLPYITEQQMEMERQKPKPYVGDQKKSGNGLIIVHIDDTLHEITSAEAEKNSKEKFKNLYSFSDEFSQTQKFHDLYLEYSKQLNEFSHKAAKSGQTVKEFAGIDAWTTSEVVSNSYSKSDVIEHYTIISDKLKDLVSNNSKKVNDDGTPKGVFTDNYIQKVNDTIHLYDRITADLKEMWGYGDLDVRA